MVYAQAFGYNVSVLAVEALPVSVKDFMISASVWRRSELAALLLMEVVCQCFLLMAAAVSAGWQLLDWKPSNLMLTRSLNEVDAEHEITFQVLLVDWAGTTLAGDLNHYKRARKAKESFMKYFVPRDM